MKTFLIVSQLIYSFCLMAWVMVWMMSFMIFDSGIYFWNTVAFIAISTFPIAAIGCSVKAWILRIRRRRTAIIINLIPTLWIAGAVVVMMIARK